MRSNFHGYTEVNCFHNHYILIQNKIIIIENMLIFLSFFFSFGKSRKISRNIYCIRLSDFSQTICLYKFPEQPCTSFVQLLILLQVNKGTCNSRIIVLKFVLDHDIIKFNNNVKFQFYCLLVQEY